MIPPDCASNRRINWGVQIEPFCIIDGESFGTWSGLLHQHLYRLCIIIRRLPIRYSQLNCRNDSQTSIGHVLRSIAIGERTHIGRPGSEWTSENRSWENGDAGRGLVRASLRLWMSRSEELYRGNYVIEMAGEWWTIKGCYNFSLRLSIALAGNWLGEDILLYYVISMDNGFDDFWIAIHVEIKTSLWWQDVIRDLS